MVPRLQVWEAGRPGQAGGYGEHRLMQAASSCAGTVRRLSAARLAPGSPIPKPSPLLLEDTKQSEQDRMEFSMLVSPNSPLGLFPPCSFTLGPSASPVAQGAHHFLLSRSICPQILQAPPSLQACRFSLPGFSVWGSRLLACLPPAFGFRC